MNRALKVLGFGFSVCMFLSLFLLSPVPRSFANPPSPEPVSLSLYLAEGCTRAGFETWLCVMNTSEPLPYVPDSRGYSFTLRVEYATPRGIIKTEDYLVPPSSRVTVFVNDVIGPEQDVSFKMTAFLDELPSDEFPSDYLEEVLAQYIMVERPMYFSYTGVGGHAPWQGGHVNTASAVPLPKKQYFAEGTTRAGFDEWICVLNPNSETASLTFNYMLAGEGLKQVKELVSPNSRGTFFVPNHVGMEKDVSLELISDIPVVAERPVYFTYTNVQNGKTAYGGHVVTGAREATSEPRTFAFAPIKFVPGMGWGNTWVCLQNPNDRPAPVNITISTTAGLIHTQRVLPPQQRTTFFYPHLIPPGYTSKEPGAFRVQAADPSLPIMVERPVYMNIEFDNISGGSVTLGAIGEDYSWARNKFAEGHTGDGFTTWMALSAFDAQNFEGDYLIDCFFPEGDKQLIAYNPEKQEGKTTWECALWRVNNQFPHTDISFWVSFAYGERIMAFTYRYGWKGLHTSGGVFYNNAGI